MITFRRAPTVQTGDQVTSRQFAGLAGAINDRAISGLGDPTFRIRFSITSMFRQLRNPDSSGFLWPAQHEFFTAYQGLPPESGEWPNTFPGFPEGANVTNPMAALVWGHEQMGAAAEADRLGALPWDLDGRAPATAEDYWRLHQLQSGGFDPSTGAVGCPAWDAARSWAAVRYGRLSPHANSYGGWLPSPNLSPTACDDPDPSDLVPAPPNFTIFFTGLRADAPTDGLHGTISTNADGFPVVTYAGTCQAYSSTGDGPPDTYLDHIAGIASTPWVTYVALWNGTVDYLPNADWIYGPFDGPPTLQKTPSGHITRIMHTFAREFRGSAAQRTAVDAIESRPRLPQSWCNKSFDFRRFFTSQYLLAPALGRAVGANIAVEYPMFTGRPTVGTQWAIPSGTELELLAGGQGGAAYTVHPGCVVPGAMVSAVGLAEPCRAHIRVDGVTIARVDLEPDFDGQASGLKFWSVPAAAGASVSVIMLDGARFLSGAGEIRAEISEMLAYKPDVSDLFLALRLSGALAS